MEMFGAVTFPLAIDQYHTHFCLFLSSVLQHLCFLATNRSLIMLSTCRIATRHATLRGSLPKTLATRSASVWANVQQGPPVRQWTQCAIDDS